jgi:hypothetical protein
MHRKTILLLITIMILDLFANRYAVIVGQNNGGKGVGSLRYAETDAKKLSELLCDIGGFERHNVLTIINSDSPALHQAFAKAEKLLVKKGNKSNALFLFYYSGHADGKSLLLGETKYSLQSLHATLNSFPSGVRVGVFDACQSGVVTAFKGGSRAEPFYFQNQQQVKGQVIIASSSAHERAQESESLKSSVFSFHWFNGLRGSADASADNNVTLNEAYQYAYRKTVETSALISGEAQHPVYRFNIYGQGDIVMTNLEQATGGFIFDRSCKGKYLVLSENYLQVYADFYKDSTAEQFISVAPGRYSIINASGTDISTCQITLEKMKVSKVGESLFTTATLTESRIKGSIQADTLQPGEDITRSPPQRFSWGIEAGVLIEQNDNKKWEQKIAAVLNGYYYLNTASNIFFDMYALGSAPSFGIDGGMDWIRQFEIGDLSAGLGVGFEFNFKKGLQKEQMVSPFLTTHLGFAADINDRVQFGVKVPYSFIINESGNYHRTGILLRVLFSGRNKKN